MPYDVRFPPLSTTLRRNPGNAGGKGYVGGAVPRIIRAHLRRFDRLEGVGGD